MIGVCAQGVINRNCTRNVAFAYPVSYTWCNYQLNILYDGNWIVTYCHCLAPAIPFDGRKKQFSCICLVRRAIYDRNSRFNTRSLPPSDWDANDAQPDYIPDFDDCPPPTLKEELAKIGLADFLIFISFRPPHEIGR